MRTLKTYFTRKNRRRKARQGEGKQDVPLHSQLQRGQLSCVLSGESCVGDPAQGAGSGHPYQSGPCENSSKGLVPSDKAQLSRPPGTMEMTSPWICHLSLSAPETGLTFPAPSLTNSQGFSIVPHVPTPGTVPGSFPSQQPLSLQLRYCFSEHLARPTCLLTGLRLTGCQGCRQLHFSPCCYLELQRMMEGPVEARGFENHIKARGVEKRMMSWEFSKNV